MMVPFFDAAGKHRDTLQLAEPLPKMYYWPEMVEAPAGWPPRDASPAPVTVTVYELGLIATGDVPGPQAYFERK